MSTKGNTSKTECPLQSDTMVRRKCTSKFVFKPQFQQSGVVRAWVGHWLLESFFFCIFMMSDRVLPKGNMFVLMGFWGWGEARSSHIPSVK